MGKFGRFLKARGVLIAAGLCIVAAGVAGVGVIDRMIDSLGGEAPSTKQEKRAGESVWQNSDVEETPVAKAESDVPKASSGSSWRGRSSSSPSGSSPAAEQPSVSEAISSPRFVRPVTGEVTAAFSGSELEYDQTMDDWRTHNGTDFAAAYGESVLSITSGSVKSVREDPLWGWCVEVEGGDGLVRYTGLAQKPAVAEGDRVAAGDSIGRVDELSAEIALEPHLHVEYEKDGALHDVMDLLAG